MIVGIGSDIIDVRRIRNIINKYGEAFKNKCFTKMEIHFSENRYNSVNSYATRYAAKEACAKALGTGLAQGIYWKDIYIVNDVYGKPLIKLTGNALKRLDQLSENKCLIATSLSDEKDYAIANVVIYESNDVF